MKLLTLARPELETEMCHQVSTFRNGVIVRMEYGTSWPAALEAAGLQAD